MIYKDQTSLRIRLTAGVDITDALSLLIKYIKPAGTTGNFTATSEDDSAGIIYYDVIADNDDIDEDGNWSFWSWVEFSDGRTAPGEVVNVIIYVEGTTVE